MNKDDSTTYDIQTGRVIPKNRDSSLRERLLKEAEKEANKLFNKFVRRGIYKEDEFDKFCVDYYLEEKYKDKPLTDKK